MNLCFSQRFILHRISLLSWHWNRLGSKSGPMASKHCGLRFSKSGYWRHVSGHVAHIELCQVKV